VAYDRSDAREARRNALAIELAEVRRKIGPRSRAGERRAALAPLAASLALLLVAPLPVHLAARGPEASWRVLREIALTTSLGRHTLNDPPRLDGAMETITMGPARLAFGGVDPDGDRFDLVIVRHPVSGRLTELDGRAVYRRTATGELLYVPNPGFVGEDDFEVALDDGIARSEVVTRRVRVYEPAPEVEARAPSSAWNDRRGGRSVYGRIPSSQIDGLFLQQREEQLMQQNRGAVSAPAERSLMPSIVTNAQLERGR